MSHTETIRAEAPTTTDAPDLPGQMRAAAESAGESLEKTREAFHRASEMKAAGHDDEEVRAELEQSMNLQGAVLTVVVAGATAYAGLQVMNSIGSTMQLTSGDLFYNSSEALEEGINGFFTNLPTVFVVIALVLIIGYLTILR